MVSVSDFIRTPCGRREEFNFTAAMKFRHPNHIRIATVRRGSSKMAIPQPLAGICIAGGCRKTC